MSEDIRPKKLIPGSANVEVQEQKPAQPKVVEGPLLPLQEPQPDARGPWVKYDGIATLRIMDERAWRSAGVDSARYVEWNCLNNMRVPMASFTQAELDYLLRRDGRFVKVDN